LRLVLTKHNPKLPGTQPFLFHESKSNLDKRASQHNLQEKENNMKTMSHYLRHAGALVMLVAAVLALSVDYRGDIVPKVRADEDVCTVETLRGSFGFTGQGLVTGSSTRPAPIGTSVFFANVGVLTFDGQGNLVFASDTFSFGGQSGQETFSGPYTVDPNCTGSMTLTFSVGGVC